MYCLRYFLLVLLFFPFPTAPPFLIFLFLISMTVEHRPCAYCSLLLSAILLSTCSWNIASVDVSPVYPNEYVQKPAGSLLSSILSFFKSNDQPSNQTQKNHTGFKSITTNHEKNQPHNRCWCYSNYGRLFEPVSSQKKVSENPELQEGHRHVSHSQDTGSNSQQSKASADDDGTNEDFELDHSIRKPRRPLKSLFTPLWKPLTKLSSVQPSLSNPEVSAKTPSSPEIYTRPDPSAHMFNTKSRPSPPKVYRSSFSRTPLFYSHFIQPLIEFVKPKMPLAVIRRIFLIINYNFLELSERISEVRMIRRTLSFFNSFKLRFLNDLLYHYRSHQPYEIRVNRLMGLQIFLKTRP
ncbi:hypothetical protein PTTG_07039 [Puccinia triticina 1-1 BBBD Race 1]|uniref:Uncharacterized protein n=2 Tax=Puccinia triticina TaxID=208348 RepID=A0A180G3U1_PUCT1|nr:uncharacterized protein PtA15_2A681 [Puccinia triticina]OAV87355.1 hypothetical protein PTTG_07039 [Puccinia triticina 1-1 BBBD Race 1]WAQ82364.1 hypothetical protein PtA15_2A681 [Puccinia triticina]WAR53220.1 hypothetical protein PtB15_2B651 [Puccinia triticina]